MGLLLVAALWIACVGGAVILATAACAVASTAWNLVVYAAESLDRAVEVVADRVRRARR